MHNPRIFSCVVDVDYGCGIIQKWRTYDYKFPINKTLKNVKEWSYFDKNKKSLLNLVTPTEFINILKVI